jgi:hypothetical protein
MPKGLLGPDELDPDPSRWFGGETSFRYTYPGKYGYLIPIFLFSKVPPGSSDCGV